MRSRSTQISRSFTPRTMPGEEGDDLTDPRANPPNPPTHPNPIRTLRPQLRVRTNTSMHGSAEGQSGAEKGTFCANPLSKYAVCGETECRVSPPRRDARDREAHTR